MAFARTTDTFWYGLGVADVDAEEGAAADVARSAVIRSSTYCVTCTRISMPSMRVSGNKGASAIKRPPKPQPTSANSGVLPVPANAG